MRVIDAAIGAAWAMEEAALVTLFEIAHREHQITPQALEAFRADKLTNAERSNALAPWLEFYNTGRRHSAIGGLPPISRLS